jgi:hypothetical protein
MKNCRLVALSVALLVSVIAGAQEKPKLQHGAGSRRVVTIAGQASDDATIVLRNSDGKVWKVSNPEILRGHEGLPVVIQGLIALEKNNEVHVLSVRAGRNEVEYMTKWDDSAFRR